MKKLFAGAALAALLATVPALRADAATATRDTTLDGDGFAEMSVGSNSALAVKTLVEADGSTIVVGTRPLITGENEVVAARFLPDGSPDPAYGAGGYAAWGATGELFDAADAVFDASGRLLISGAVRTVPGPTSRAMVLRLTTDGSLDGTFGTGGVVRYGTPTSDFQAFESVHLGPGGTVLLVGGVASTTTGYTVRLTSTGALDPTYGTGGTEALTWPGRLRVASSVRTADGSLVVAGSLVNSPFIDNDVAVVRLTPAGAIDPTFGGGLARFRFAPNATDEMVTDVAVASDGSVVVGGSVLDATWSGFVVRFTPSGGIDTQFGVDGAARIDARDDDRVTALALLPDDSIVAVGSSTEPAEPLRSAATHLRRDGSLDPEFGTAGTVTTAIDGRGRTAADVVVRADGRVVVGSDAGDFGIERFTLSWSGLVPVAPVRLLDTRAAGPLDAGDIVQVDPGAPAGTRSVLVNLTMTEGQADGYISADSCDAIEASAASQSSGNFEPDQNIANSAVVNLGADGTFCVYVSAPVNVLVDLQGRYASEGLRFTPVTPQRTLDTRSGTRPAANSITRVVPSVPAGTQAVLVNLTMTDATRPGYVTADRCSAMLPGAQPKSNGNFVPGRNVANSAVVALDGDGSFCIYAEQPVHLLADVQGVYRSVLTRDLVTAAPRRVLDTRSGTRPAANSITRVAPSVPAGTQAVLVNLTMTDAALPGYVTADRCSALVPGGQTKSNGNFVPGAAIANSAVVNVDADGAFCIYAEQPVHLLVDVQGTY